MSNTKSNNIVFFRLSILRMIFAIVLIFSGEIRHVHQYLEMIPKAKMLQQWPWWLQWFSIDVIDIFWVQGMIYVGSILILLGWKSHLGLRLTLLGNTIVFSLLQIHHPIHIHHLWWFNVLLLFSPCDQYWTLKKSNLCNRYHPAQFLKNLQYCLGFIFLFPGIHKLLSPDWMNGSILHNTLLWKQAQYWNLDLWSLAIPDIGYAGMAALVAMVEIALCLLIIREKYTWFLLVACLFHLGIWLCTGIVFSNLWIFYVAFLPFEKFFSIPPLPPLTNSVQEKHWWHIPSFFVLLGIFAAGIQNQQQGFPWIAYPSFTRSISAKMPMVALVLVNEDSKNILPYTDYIAPNNAAWASNWALMTQHYPQQFEHYFQQLTMHSMLPSTNSIQIEFWTSYLDTQTGSRIPILRNHLYTIHLQ